MATVAGVPEWVASQRGQALAKANEIRISAGRLKREIAAGLPLSKALSDPRAQALEVSVVLMAMPHWGPVRVRKLLCRALINEHRRVRDLTSRQRERLCAEVR